MKASKMLTNVVAVRVAFPPENPCHFKLKLGSLTPALYHKYVVVVIPNLLKRLKQLLTSKFRTFDQKRKKKNSIQLL